MLKIINLMENTPGETGCAFEHGLSLYVETDRHRVLIDTGASSQTWNNAARLGIDLSKIDSVIISHGHYDHAGGLMSFIEQNGSADIYMRPECDGEYFADEKEGMLYIGIDKAIMSLPQLVLTGDFYRIDDEISVFSGVTGENCQPRSNQKLKKLSGEGYVQDDFIHEQNVVIAAEGKRILIAGCAHKGILNILSRFEALYGGLPDMVIGGFHMMKPTDYTEDEIHIIDETAKALTKMTGRFYTGHCTGQKAFDRMKKIMGDQLIYMHSGDTILSESK